MKIEEKSTRENRIGNRYLLALFSLIISWTYLNAQNNIIELRDFSEQGIKLVGFTLNNGKEIQIDAVGAGFDKEIRKTKHSFVDIHSFFAYAWILNAHTRELEWRMTISNTDEDWWDKYNRAFKGKVWLESGEYELYFSAMPPSYSLESGFFSFRNIFDKVFRSEDWWEDHSGKWKIIIKGIDATYDKSAVLKYHQAVKKSAVVYLTEVGNDEQVSAGFTLKKPAAFKIYAIGEGFNGEMFDYAYIINAETNSRVWEMIEEETEYAGGAIKNRMISKEINLEPGDYVVYFTSDPSHSFESWNSNPPYDPNFWGITISGVGDVFDKSIVTKYEEKEGVLIVRLDKLGDDENVSEGFKVMKPMKSNES